MDELTQQNAALVEQATAASHSLADQSRELNQLMERYNIGAAERPPAARRSARAEAAAEPRKTQTKTDSRRPVPSARRSSPAKSDIAATPPLAKASGDDGEWQEF
jgi:methyl-accepting chemotaxis protein